VYSGITIVPLKTGKSNVSCADKFRFPERNSSSKSVVAEREDAGSTGETIPHSALKHSNVLPSL
jgi:hypothetical protein